MTQRLSPDASGIAAAASLLAGGGTVAFPTETVYGLGADARDDRAVARIFAAKDRPAFNPLIVHLAEARAAAAIVRMSAQAERLAAAFWPGALTLVLPLRSGACISALASAGLATLGIRVPDHPVARALLTAFGGPVAAPSANPSGRLSPTSADHVLFGLGGRIDAVLDGGAAAVGVESTIVALDPAPVLLRLGGTPPEAIEACLGTALARPGRPEGTGRPGDSDSAGGSRAPTSPGQLASHYAPRGTLRLDATTAQPGEVHIGFGPVKGTLTLSESGDLLEAASRLFALLHDLDRQGAGRIAVAPIPDRGLGAAINDRLRRAAAPRPSP